MRRYYDPRRKLLLASHTDSDTLEAFKTLLLLPNVREPLLKLNIPQIDLPRLENEVIPTSM
jgi:hypothetical protein